MKRFATALVRWWTWALALGDDKGAPSFSKGITAAVVVASLYVVVSVRAITAGAVTLLVACIAASFGRSVFLSWLSRYTAVTTVSQVDTDDGRGP